MHTLTQPLALYQPTPAEVDSVLTKAFAAWPTLASRILSARALLLDGNIAADGAYWQVASQSGKCSHYTITSRQHCSCPDRGQRCGERTFCKHNIAVTAYVRILRNKLQADIAGFDVELAVLATGNFKAYAPQMGYVEVRKNGDGVYEFANVTSAMTYAVWLAHVNTPVAVAWPTREESRVAA